MHSLSWSGSQRTHLDEPTVLAVGRVSVAVYGGNTSAGARKNEDGALVWVSEDWVFAAVLDAHAGAQSTNTVLDLLAENRDALQPLLEDGRPATLPRVLDAVLAIFTSPDGRKRLAGARGETACLVCFQRGRFLAWLSIGDNALYLLHPELARLGQFTLSTRNYFEWIGQRDSLALEVPCYSSGIRELRRGEQTVVLATDGLLEFGDHPYEPPEAFAAALSASPDLSDSLMHMLQRAHAAGATDSATAISWRITCAEQGLMPTS